MFEKEAEEYRKPYIGKTVEDVHNDLDVIVYNTYLAGAEYGYNKAKDYDYAKLEEKYTTLQEKCNSLQELVNYYQTNFCQEG